MKKLILAISLMGLAGAAVAAEDFTPGTITERQAAPSNWIYTVAETRAERLFVKNQFDFTLSTNVVMNADEDPDGRFMVVATGNTQGRNVYVSHSNGGSVNSCGDPLTAAEANESGAISAAVEARWAIDDLNGCTEDDVE
jgi:hypothetical protein